MKKFIALFLLSGFLFCLSGMDSVYAAPAAAKSEMFVKGRKKNRGYQKPRSKKILGIFKRKTDCGCPKH